MTTEQALLAGYAPMATAIGVLFKLLLDERKERLAFVEKKLQEQTDERAATQEMHRTLIQVMKAQEDRALPGRRSGP